MIIFLPSTNALDFFLHEKRDVLALAHVCNCQGVMGSGIAKSIRERFPVAYDAYKKVEYDDGGLTLGTISYGRVGEKFIFNLHAQNYYGTDGQRYLNYEALYVSLCEMRDRLQVFYKGGNIAIPYKMGCDRAGGNWEIVSAMINEVFKNFDVYICQL